MAGMLPPFVPPSARVSTQPLPLITEFVLDRGDQPVEQRFEQPFEQSFSIDQWEPPPSEGEQHEERPAREETLPSIEAFLLREPVENPGGFAETSPQMANENTMETATAVETAPEPSTQTATETAPWAEDLSQPPAWETAESAPVSEEEPVQQESVQQGPADQGPADQGPADQEPADQEPAEQEAVQPARPAIQLVNPAEQAQEAGAGSWVGEERDAFDWQGLAGLAIPADEERRASEEWLSTDWERPGASSQDRVAALLLQVARRVRSGELLVQSSRNMSTEAALAAVLAALLAEPGGL